MTEAEAMEIMIGLNESIFGGANVWLSVTFAYLTAAYFLGKSLTTFQCRIISVLYGVMASLSAFAIPTHVYAWQSTRLSVQTVYDGALMIDNIYSWIGGTGFFFFGGTVAALYFMFDIRRNRET